MVNAIFSKGDQSDCWPVIDITFILLLQLDQFVLLMKVNKLAAAAIAAAAAAIGAEH